MTGGLRVLWLYPTHMSTYGDAGNVQAVRRRLADLGVEGTVDRLEVGDRAPRDVDLVLGGGGQDSGQERVHADLLAHGGWLAELAADGVPMLLVCGMYQLFGHRVSTASGAELDGLGVLDVVTAAGRGRLVGNVRARSPELGTLVGYENHSGRTVLGPRARPLARVSRGRGNNGRDRTEGARWQHVVGTYLHGPVLPLNPALLDLMVTTAVSRRFGPDAIAGHAPPPDAAEARAAALRRPR
ncbi:type 1 glutamine amidotransferase [Cellulosimicrobium cellulans]|uniref:type 1 glutamine amidotransferase n=1 Tax=Cellulosimicrobium cellulans TaxID=1710 RepID=UPI00130ECD60|nr:glutamine amidotransferase [Cellulosimicrobium cellulans]